MMIFFISKGFAKIRKIEVFDERVPVAKSHFFILPLQFCIFFLPMSDFFFIFAILKTKHDDFFSLANYSVAYEETPLNRVSDFREFVCSLFPKAILFYFYFTLL